MKKAELEKETDTAYTPAQISVDIEKRETEYLTADAKLKVRRDEVASAKSRVAAAIALEKTSDQKPRYSNDLVRGVELETRLAGDAQYQSWLELLDKEELAQKVRRLELDRLYRDFSTAKILMEALLLGRRER